MEELHGDGLTRRILMDDTLTTAHLGLDWATRQMASKAWQVTATRLTMAHLRLSYPDTEIPGGHRSPADTFLFTDAEVTSLVEVSRQAGPRGSLRPHNWRR